MASVVARILMALGATAVLAAGSAHASDVHWSVGIQAPVGPGVSLGTVISNGYGMPGVAPVMVAPPPVYVPAPVGYSPPVVYAPAPIYAPSRVVYGAPVWARGHWVRYPVHHHPYPGVWRPGFDHRGPPVPVRMPGREVRY